MLAGYNRSATGWMREARRGSRAGATSTAESLPRAYGPGSRFYLLLCLRRCAPAIARCARGGLAVLLCSPPDTMSGVVGSVETSTISWAECF